MYNISVKSHMYSTSTVHVIKSIRMAEKNIRIINSPKNYKLVKSNGKRFTLLHFTLLNARQVLLISGGRFKGKRVKL